MRQDWRGQHRGEQHADYLRPMRIANIRNSHARFGKLQSPSGMSESISTGAIPESRANAPCRQRVGYFQLIDSHSSSTVNDGVNKMATKRIFTRVSQGVEINRGCKSNHQVLDQGRVSSNEHVST